MRCLGRIELPFPVGAPLGLSCHRDQARKVPIYGCWAARASSHSSCTSLSSTALSSTVASAGRCDIASSWGEPERITPTHTPTVHAHPRYGTWQYHTGSHIYIYIGVALAFNRASSSALCFASASWHRRGENQARHRTPSPPDTRHHRTPSPSTDRQDGRSITHRHAARQAVLYSF